MRVGAGKRGANGLIYAWSERTEKDWSGGRVRSGFHTPTPSTYNKTRIYVTSYAIFYRHLE